jgi:hypothetical protein
MRLDVIGLCQPGQSLVSPLWRLRFGLSTISRRFARRLGGGRDFDPTPCLARESTSAWGWTRTDTALQVSGVQKIGT